MRLRTATLVLFALVVLVSAATGATADSGASRPTGTQEGANVTTGDVIQLSEGSVSLLGRVDGIDERTTVRVWFEYHRVGSADGWRRTGGRNLTGPGRFAVNATDLGYGTQYEFRARARVGNETLSGSVREFETDPAVTDGGELTPTPTSTPSPDPCPEYRGAGSLCTRTPTPATDPGIQVDSVEEAGPEPERARDDWLSGLVPLLLWAGAVALAAPLLLGGLLWLDSLRGAE